MQSDPVKMFPGGAPDQETFDLMARLADLQGWCVLMTQKDSGGIAAGQLVQETRAFIVERLYPNAIAARKPLAHLTKDSDNAE